RILTPTISSPTLADQLRNFLKVYPQAKWHVYEPVNRDNVLEGAKLAFGQPVETRYDFEKADVIVSLDADFLYAGFPGNVHISRKPRIQKVRVERDNDVGLFEIVAGLNRLAEGHLRALEYVVTIHRLIHMPLGLRINLQEIAQLIGQRGRRNGRRKDANARALQGLLCTQWPTNRGNKALPRPLIAHRDHALRAVRIVHAKNRRLGKNIGAA